MTDLYIVEQRDKPSVATRYRPPANFLAETNITDATEEATLRDLLNGQFDDRAVKVYKLTDVTEEFRAKLQDKINRNKNNMIPDWLTTFMMEW